MDDKTVTTTKKDTIDDKTVTTTMTTTTKTKAEAEAEADIAHPGLSFVFPYFVCILCA